jgi:hypothetical protein
VLIACLLSFSLFTMPFVPMAAAMSRSDNQASSLRRDKSSQGQRTVKATVGVNAPVAAPAPEPFAPVITATKVDALINDDGDGKADPGNTEKIEYTVTISNTGSTDATNVQFTDTIDTHTTLVGGSITTQPIAVADSYSSIGNVGITVPDGASDLLGNDCDPDPAGGPCTNAGLTITTLAGDNSAPFAGTSAQGGQVTATTGDGSFQYNPAPGFEGTDTFTYTVTDGTGKSDTATVTVNVSGMIWFVNAGAGGGGDGRLNTPFNCLVGAGCFSGTTADDPGDFIFLYSGTYNDTAALVLLNNQKLIGAAATVPLAGPGSVTGFTIPTFSNTLPSTNQASPVITSLASGIQLASGNLLRGFTVGNTLGTGANYDILNTSTATVGTLTILEVVLNGTGGLFRVDAGGALNVNFASASTTSAGGNGIQIASASGTVGIGGSNTITGVAGSDVLISGGTVALTCSANITHAAGSNPMVSIGGGHLTGAVTFTGTLNASSGTGLLFDNADSTYNFNGTTTLNGGDAGIDVLNGSGGTFNFGGTTITNPSGVALNVSASSGAITISGAISKNTDGKLIDFDNYDTGTATISGDLSCTSLCDGVEVTNDGSSSGTVNFSGANKTLNTSASPAVNLDNNDGGTVNFTNGNLDIDTTSGSGFVATNGGTVTVQGTNNTITSTTGTGLNVANTTIGASGLTFQSINVDGNDAAPTNGIVLNSTGTSAGLTVTGTGSAGTGGTIRDASGDGISLTTTEKLSLSWMSITSNLGSGIGGSGINGLQIANCSITSNGDSAATDDSGINVTQLIGTNSGGLRPTSITNTTVSNNFEFQIQITNSSGTLTDLTMSGNTISTSAPAVSGNLFNFLGNGTASMKLSLTSGSFTGNWTPATPSPGPAVISGTAISAVTQGTGGHTVNVSGATFTNNNAGVDCSTTNVSTTFSCNVSNNNFQGSRAVAINSFHNGNAPFTRTFNGTFSNNIIGTANSANSGSFNGRAIDISNEGVITTANYTISGNTINEVGTLGTAGAEGIGVNVGLGGLSTGGGATNVTISGNTISNIRNSRGLIVADNQDPAHSPFPTICANITGNTFAGVIAGQAGNGQFMRIRELSGTVNVTQATPTAAAIATELDDANGFNDPTKISIGGTPQFSQPACTGSTAMPTTSMLEPRQNVAPNSSAPAAVNAVVTTGETSTSTKVSQPSLWARAFNAIASVTSEVGSLIEPTAHAEASERGSTEQPVVETGKRSHHATIGNRSHNTRAPRALNAPVAGETVGPIIIGTLRPGDSVVITFQVTVNNPPNLTGVPPGTPQVENQGSVTYAESGTPVLTDDPAVGGGADKTATPVDLFDTSTNLISGLNPSNFGDSVTFTATVSETPTQATADPTGTVDFIDTSNGNAVICNDVALTAGSAGCTTSSLTAGTHNIRADYSGDGNFDPSQSNVVAQVVIACTTDPIVTSAADSGAGTLREALANACTGSTITFNIAPAGPDTITLTTGELLISKDNLKVKNISGDSITVSGNNASRVFNVPAGKTLAIIGLTITGGNAASGAGVLNNGTLSVVNSTLTGNTATSDGGGIGNSATATSLTLINTTISGNNANGSGGGVVVLAGTMTSINSTITNNFADADNNSSGTGGGISAQAGTTTLKNTIVAGNFNEDGASDAADDIGGTVDAASSFNLIGTGGAGGLTNGGNGNQVGVANAGLGPLANNGGTTQTHALLSTSAAIEAGSNANLPTDAFDVDGDLNTAETLPFDQRGTGFPRVADSADANLTQTVDIGAYESHPTIEDVANTSTNEDTVKNVTFNIGDDTGSLISTVTATSSNTTLVPNANLVITGSGGSRNLQITPATNESGTTTITLTVTATNGRTATDTFDLTVNAVNDAPVANNDSYSTNEDTPLTVNAANGVLFNDTDIDTPHGSLTAILVSGPSNALSFTLNADGSFNYTPTSNFNGADTFMYKANDGSLDSNVATVTITVNAVNDSPTVAINTGITVAEGSTNNTITNTMLRVDDVDNTATQIVFTIGTAPVNGTLKKSGGALAAGGTFTQDDINNNRITYDHNGSETTSDSFTFTVSDGAGGTIGLTTFNITITGQDDAPSITAGGTLNYTENDPATAIDTTITVTDPDSTNLASATVTINANYVNGQDVLSFTNTATINGSFNAGTGTLSLTGSDTVANYQAALRAVKYNNTSDNPSTAARTVSWSVNDGTLPSNVATSTINVAAVNDGPANVVPGPQSTNQNTPLVFSSGNGNQISVTDVDAGTNAIQVTLTATNGTVTLSGTSGLNFVCGGCNGDGTADATMTFQGTISNINAALNGMTFTPTNGFSGAASLTITSNDLGNTGSGGPLSDTDTVAIQVATNVSIQDAQVAEPKSGSVNMIFTVTLSAPAPAGGSSVDYTTFELAPALNHATAGQDYTTTAGTLTFAAGEQVKTIQVPVLSDNKKSEANESFEVHLSNPVNCTIADGTATGTIIENDTAGAVLISELRTSGPAGAGDDFVEIYNNSDSPLVVNGTNGGYGLFKMGATCSDTPVLLGVIPNGTTIPARGHYLFVGSAYSLANYGGSGAAAGDQTMAQDIESDRNVALFSTGSLLAIGSANRLDAVGFGSNVGATCDLFREGTTLTPTSGSTLEHSYFRDECGKKGNPSTFGNCPTGGLTKDSNVNGDDFIFADTNATATVMGQRLGAPGPQNLGSPRYTINVVAFLLDSSKSAAGNPNRVRDTTAIGPNAATGTMSIRRRFQNNTGAPVTRLRIRVVDISTTFIASGGVADLRLLTSGDTTDVVSDPATCTASGFPSSPCTVTIRGTVLETPPAQPLGGGFNASATTGVITLANPLPAGASINLQLVLGVQTTGSFKFFFNIEALP